MSDSVDIQSPIYEKPESQVQIPSAPTEQYLPQSPYIPPPPVGQPVYGYSPNMVYAQPVQYIQATPPQTIDEPLDQIDNGPEIEWELVFVGLSAGGENFTIGRGRQRLLQEYKIKLPPNDYNNIYAATNYYSYKGLNIGASCCVSNHRQTYPLSNQEYQLQTPVDPGHRILMVCSENELKQYVNVCNDALRPIWSKMSRLNCVHKCFAYLLLLGFFVAFVLPFVLLATGNPNFVLLLITPFVSFIAMTILQLILSAIMKIFYVRNFKEQFIELQKVIMKTRGPFMQKGVKPRPGPYAAYIKFETR